MMKTVNNIAVEKYVPVRKQLKAVDKSNSGQK